MHDDRHPLWFERRARDVTPGDFVLIDEPDGRRPRIVRSVIPNADGGVVIRYWNGVADVGHVWPADQLIEIV